MDAFKQLAIVSLTHCNQSSATMCVLSFKFTHVYISTSPAAANGNSHWRYSVNTSSHASCAWDVCVCVCARARSYLWRLLKVKVKVKLSKPSTNRNNNIGYSEVVCHAGQTAQRESIYIVYIAPCQGTQNAHTWIIQWHSFTCKLHHACMCRTRSPDGATPNRWKASDWSLLVTCRPRRDERLSWSGWLTYSGWLTHISGYSSATGRAHDREVRRRKPDVLLLFHATQR